MIRFGRDLKIGPTQRRVESGRVAAVGGGKDLEEGQDQSVQEMSPPSFSFD